MTELRWDDPLLDDLPPCTLVLSPDPALAWTFASMLASRHAVDHGANIGHYPQVTMAGVTEIIRASHIFRAPPLYAVFCLGLDKSAEAVQHALLKTLEEPSPSARFILAAETALPTIMSRSVVRRIGLPGERSDILSEARPAVIAAVAAAAAGDSRRLGRLTRDWDAASVAMLGVWAAESYTGRFLSFTPGDMQGYQPSHFLGVLGALARYSTARPRLAAQAALGSLPAR